MRLLILGGTQFVGRHLARAALDRGHAVTLFNRGRTNPDLYPEAEKLRGDRAAGDLDALHGRTWDAALDVTGYVPRWVRDTAGLLHDAVGHYTFVSTISVYDADRLPPHAGEGAPLQTLADEGTEDFRGPAYGGLKALCEQAAEERFPGRALIPRLGLMYGPYDNTDRTTYWVARVAQGGEVLVPGAPDQPLQLLDARDLADFILDGTQKGLAGVFNTAGATITFARLIEACREVTAGDASFTWIDDEAFLQEHGPAQERTFGTLPLWVPARYENLFTVDSSRARAHGLAYRPLSATLRDILAYVKSLPPDHDWRAGLAPEQERALLQAWHARPKR